MHTHISSPVVCFVRVREIEDEERGGLAECCFDVLSDGGIRQRRFDDATNRRKGQLQRLTHDGKTAEEERERAFATNEERERRGAEKAKKRREVATHPPSVILPTTRSTITTSHHQPSCSIDE